MRLNYVKASLIFSAELPFTYDTRARKQRKIPKMRQMNGIMSFDLICVTETPEIYAQMLFTACHSERSDEPCPIGAQNWVVLARMFRKDAFSLEAIDVFQ